ncbi:hypothetical protein [Frigoriglobus tundricola]|uniref:Uncharacterized protein n=1 Tax=Frigoriglobus tundricola TaxID=2774151 RepID=A0A6M5YXE5_9BACT|nr:hypothetical protein [Frigoriglobus tundricola]QJW98787.1 hypothetical protein FTUN_6382 [Frigoriglobus tundricola]
MIRICERLVGVNVLVGLVALVLGLAAVPQTVTAAPAPPPCTGTCKAVFGGGLCAVTSMCMNCTGCNVNLVFNQNGVLIGCNGGTCV